MDVDTRARQALSRYIPWMLGERHFTLTHRSLVWALERTGSPNVERHAKEAFLSSTFEVFCAPPGATLDENLVSMKFLLVFFRADDAPPEALDEFVAWLDREGPAADGALAAYHSDLSLDFDARGRDSEGFRKALRAMCASMQLEKRADKATMTEDQYRRLRQHTVAVPAYTECWRTIRGLTMSKELQATQIPDKLCELAAEIVYVVNDIGSLERDEDAARNHPANVDPNLVLLRTRSLGDRDAALEDVIRQGNRGILEFQRMERLVRESEHGAHPALDGYLGILRSTVNGNLATTKHLVPMRYPGALGSLGRLGLV